MASESTDPAAIRRRLHAELEDTVSSAKDTWCQAEKALNRALRDAEKRKSGGAVASGPKPGRSAPWQVPPPAEVPTPTATRAASPSAPRASPAPRAASAAMLGVGLAAAEAEEEAAARSAQRQARIVAARENANDFRRTLMNKRASDARDRLADHAKRKLRAKVVGIVLEVQRKQALDLQEAKQKKLLEERDKVARGLAGDAEPLAVAAEPLEPAASPRRSRLLEELTLDELQMMRADPWFFFDSPLLANEGAEGEPPGTASSANVSTSAGGDEGSGSVSASTSAGGSREGVIDFFIPTKDDKSLSIADYAKKLRAQLDADIEEARWKLLPLKPPDRKRPADDTELWVAEERMPCQGRRPAVREDLRSPTLAKVRQVYNRREEADAKWLEDKRDAMTRRINLNDFKAKEQQREAQMQAERQKELHKVRLLEAQERKAAAEAMAQDSMNHLEKQAQIKLIKANNKAEDMLEAKRDKASGALDNWYEGVERAERYLRWEERQQVARAEAKWNTYVERLWKVGQARHSASQSHMQQNGDLKSRIQKSLIEQITERQRERGEQIMESIDTKLAAAARRRRLAQRGGRYGLLERAFGEDSVGFDAKYHTVQTDRRSPSWRRSAEEWASQSASFDGGGRSMSDSSLHRPRA